VSQAGEKHLRINRVIRGLQDHADGNHSNHSTLAHEAVFEEPASAVPADCARVNLESLKYFEVMTKLCERIANHRKRLVLSCNSENAGTHNSMRASNVGERKISTVVDVEIKVQVVGPYAQAHTSGREQIDLGLADQA
jgi:hypothetical protein